MVNHEDTPSNGPPTERTTLLGSANGGGRAYLALNALPEIGPAVEHARAQGGHFSLPELPTPQAESAYKLVVLLQAIVQGTQTDTLSNDGALEQWNCETNEFELAGALEAQVMSLWNDILGKETGENVEDVLWMAFPYNDGDEPSITGTTLDSVLYSRTNVT
jgi:hypothetical protein